LVTDFRLPHFACSGYVRQRTAHPGTGGDNPVNRGKHAIRSFKPTQKGNLMNSIIYIVGAIVIIVAILSFLGLR
jgi:hypothetical protein